MTLTTTTNRHGEKEHFYRCSAFGPDCPQRVSIKADTIEQLVTDATLAEVASPAAFGDHEPDETDLVAEAREALDKAQAELDTAIRVLDIVGNEPAAIERLEQLTRAKDDAAMALDNAKDREVMPPFEPDERDSSDVETQRAIVKAIIARMDVGPGRGTDRVHIELTNH